MNHRIFDRTLRSPVFRGACLFECREILNLQTLAVLQAWIWRLAGFYGRLLLKALARSLRIGSRCDNYLRRDREAFGWLLIVSLKRQLLMTSDLKSGRTTR